jgi:hypothetical protein
LLLFVPVVGAVPVAAVGAVAVAEAAVPVVAQGFLNPALPVAAAPVVPLPKGAVVPGVVVVLDGGCTTAALLPVRPEAPIPAPVLDAPPVLPLLVCAVAKAGAPSSNIVARGRILIAFMQGSLIWLMGV